MRRTDKEMRLDAGDVSVNPLLPALCSECDDAPATHAVLLDFRGNGSVHAVTQACESCANEFADRLRASLPAAGRK